MLSKVECRKKVKTLMNEQKQYLPELSKKVLVLLQENIHFIKAQRVLLYYSLPDEIFTHQFLDETATQKRVFLPVIREGKMFVAEFHSSENLIRGTFNIFEPQCDFYDGEIDVAVVPGVAFDEFGHRLGRGKGFYDKFLAQCNCYKIGICFSFQRFNLIPSEAHDVPMDEVISDQ